MSNLDLSWTCKPSLSLLLPRSVGCFFAARIQLDVCKFNVTVYGANMGFLGTTHICEQCAVFFILDVLSILLQLSIIEYLDETRGPPYLLPRDDPFKRQQVYTT